MRPPGHARRGLAIALALALAAAAHAQPFTVNESTEERSYIPMYPVEGAIISNQVRRGWKGWRGKKGRWLGIRAC